MDGIFNFFEYHSSMQSLYCSLHAPWLSVLIIMMFIHGIIAIPVQVVLMTLLFWFLSMLQALVCRILFGVLAAPDWLTGDDCTSSAGLWDLHSQLSGQRRRWPDAETKVRPLITIYPGFIHLLWTSTFKLESGCVCECMNECIFVLINVTRDSNFQLTV